MGSLDILGSRAWWVKAGRGRASGHLDPYSLLGGVPPGLGFILETLQLPLEVAALGAA